MNVIDVNGVSLIIGQSKILDDISFHVEEGNIHALIGNNGAGKTSLLKILLGLTPSYGGYLKFLILKILHFIVDILAQLWIL